MGNRWLPRFFRKNVAIPSGWSWNKLENHHFSGSHETINGPLSTAILNYRRVYVSKSKIESKWTSFGRSESRRLNLDMEKYVNSTDFDKKRIFEPRNWESPIIVCSPATKWELSLTSNGSSSKPGVPFWMRYPH